MSGLEGAFINASFSTANFLGAGETFSVSAQTGKRTKNYQIAITEPYFLDRPITAGFDVFKRKITYVSYVNVVGYTQEGTGASLIFGIPVKRWGRLLANYSYEVVNLSDVTQDIQGNITPVAPSTASRSSTRCSSAASRARRAGSSPSLMWNTVDNPYSPSEREEIHREPHRGRGAARAAPSTTSGPTSRPSSTSPTPRRRPWASAGTWPGSSPTATPGSCPTISATSSAGETQIRGYNLRTVGPIDSSGRALGGNKYLLLNAEYYFDVFGPLRALVFFDAGQAFLEDARASTSRSSAPRPARRFASSCRSSTFPSASSTPGTRTVIRSSRRRPSSSPLAPPSKEKK